MLENEIITEKQADQVPQNEQVKAPQPNIDFTDPNVVKAVLGKIRDIEQHIMLMSEYTHQIKDLANAGYEDMPEWAERIQKEQNMGNEPDYRLKRKSGIIV